jgi:transcriptional regulator with XRE-family HTH domain
VSEPLIGLLKRVRLAHHLSQESLEECMGLPHGTYRHLERGRRDLPDMRHGLVAWVQMFEACVEATTEERVTILHVLSRSILGQFAALLQDIEQRRE